MRILDTRRCLCLLLIPSSRAAFSTSCSGSGRSSSKVKVYMFPNQPELPPITPSAKRLFLVRHGEVIPPGGVHGVFYGALDVPLSPLGEAEATAAGQYLSQFDLEHIAASPLKRAVYGAKEVLKYQSNFNKNIQEEQRTGLQQIRIYDGFRELDRGAWCGKTKAEIGEELMTRFDLCDESVTPEGGESYPFLKARVLAARDELLSKMTSGKASAVVSHLQVTRSILSDAIGVPTQEMTKLKVGTASVTCIDYCCETNLPTVHFQSFKPDAGLEAAQDGGVV